eukprot:TRINITY_DN1689_c0_g3_i2.p1 TRINITY_DN1689_c0_g3~~TRINITY_DN1689_c0_g3_i2.p1  ORF type:complete len:111 (+),score=21.76 TRINITY_DN1689_c0_g3_i2:107-439(+)
MPQLDEHGLPPASGENEPCVEDMEESDDEVDENEKDEFYDDKVDQMDEAWVRKNRASAPPLHPTVTRVAAAAGHQSDATLNCPCCLTTLCYDCQKCGSKPGGVLMLWQAR